jgi:arabinose-5-phosphate isomerase
MTSTPVARPDVDPVDVIAVARRVLSIEADALAAVAARLDAAFIRAVDVVAQCRGRLVLSGLGKSGIMARKIAATLSSTGTPAFFLHPAEALHGDIGAVMAHDVLVALSHSGETPELVAFVDAVRPLGVPVVLLTGHPASSLGRGADVTLDCSVDEEACPLNLAPTASTTAALALGDALAMSVLARKGFSVDDFAARHPGGTLGRRLMRVDQLMHAGDGRPLVGPETPLGDVIYEMSRKGLGMTCVVDATGRLVGLITDGDLRRTMLRDAAILDRLAGDVMTRTPVTLPPDVRVAQALAVMESHRITSVPVVDATGVVQGVLHIHDLWQMERP